MCSTGKVITLPPIVGLPRPADRLSRRIDEHVRGMELAPAAIAHMAIVAAVMNPNWAMGVAAELERQFGNNFVNAAAADFVKAAYLKEG